MNILDHRPDELRAVMEKEKLNWRSFANGRAIARSWNSPATPSYYLFDHRGTIRHKWIGNPGAEAIDRALARWIREAERDTTEK